MSFVLIAGDHVVNPDNHAEWIQYTQKLSDELTSRGIPYLAVPGNHDQDEFGTPLYTQYMAPPGIWDASTAELRGQNWQSATTGWEGLRFVGLNNSWVGWNTIRPAEQDQLAAIVSARAFAGENVCLLAHHRTTTSGSSRWPSCSRRPESRAICAGTAGSLMRPRASTASRTPSGTSPASPWRATPR